MQILDIDDDDALVAHTFYHDSLRLWPLVRWEVLDRIQRNENPGASGKQRGSRRLSIRQLALYALMVVRKSPLRIRERFPYLVMSRGIPSMQMRDGRYFNLREDEFALFRERETVIIELSHKMRIFEPRCFPNTYYWDIIKIRAVLEGMLRRVTRSDRQRIETFIGHLDRKFGNLLPTGYLRSLTRYLETLRRRLPTYERLYRKMFRRIKPSILFLHCACYGAEGFLVKWAKEEGVRVAEFQHGSITERHIAYNHSPRMQRQDLNAYFPDVLLLYGNIWKELMSNSIQKVVIGNPYHTDMQAKLAQGIGGDILVLSQWTVTMHIVALATDLARKSAGKHRVVFRPHPAEYLTNAQKALLEVSGAVIDRESNLYECIARACAVVGCYSTALFEAFGSGAFIFILDHALSAPGILDRIGTRIRDADSVLRFLAGKVPMDIRPPALEEIWASGWKERYLRFLDESTSS